MCTDLTRPVLAHFLVVEFLQHGVQLVVPCRPAGEVERPLSDGDKDCTGGRIRRLAREFQALASRLSR